MSKFADYTRVAPKNLFQKRVDTEDGKGVSRRSWQSEHLSQSPSSDFEKTRTANSLCDSNASSTIMAPSSHTSLGSAIPFNETLSLPLDPDSSPLLAHEPEPVRPEPSPEEADLQARIDRLGGVVAEIGIFVDAQDEIIGLRISTQQKRKAITRARNTVSECDKALMDAVRTARADDGILDPTSLVSLINELEEARNTLGPLEDDMDKLEFLLVPKEFELKMEGEKIRRRYLNLSQSLPDPLDTHETSSSYASSEITSTPIENGDTHMRTVAPVSSTGSWTEAVLEDEQPSPGIVRATASKFSAVFSTLNSTSNTGPNVDTFAPDLSQQSPWMLSGADPGDKQLEYVIDRDLDDDKASDTDTLEQGDVLLLDRDLSTPPLSYAATTSQGVGGLVNGWILHALQTSRWEVLSLRAFVAARTIGVEWLWASWATKAKEYWDKDDAATFKIPLAPRTSSNSTVLARQRNLKVRRSLSEGQDTYDRKLGKSPLTIKLRHTSITRSGP